MKKEMETEKELNAEIIEITMTIREKYPELTAYLMELPGTIPDKKDPQIDIKTLMEYRNTLRALVDNYVKEHPELIH
jgi:hypothetical protein